MNEEISELVKDAIDDATLLVRSEAQFAKEKAEEVALASAASTSLAAAGMMTAVFGGGLLLAAPAVPQSLRALRRRMLLVGLLYLGGGLSAATVSTVATQRALRASLERAQRDLRQTGRAAQEGFERAQTS